MSSKKVYDINDRVFAKIRGYPAWPAKVSAAYITPSGQKYGVYFYGTGERAECKPDVLFPYEENKIKLGKPNKRKNFAEALLEIEKDSQQCKIVKATNFKINESNEKESKGKELSSSKKSLGISKGTKRKISEVLETSKLYIRPIELVKTKQSSSIEKATSGQKSTTSDINLRADENASQITSQITRKPSSTGCDPALILPNIDSSVLESSDAEIDTSITVKSIQKVKDNPTSNSEILSNSSSVDHVSQSSPKIKPKQFTDYHSFAKTSIHSRLSKEISKSSEKQNNGVNENYASYAYLSEQNLKTKGSSSKSSEIQKSSENCASASVPQMNEVVFERSDNVSNRLFETSEGIPDGIKDQMSYKIGSKTMFFWNTVEPRNTCDTDPLHIEVELLDFTYKLRKALRVDRADCDKAIWVLEQICELQMTPLMLKKNDEVVDTIRKIINYSGNLHNWNLNEQEILEHTEKATQIRRLAEKVYEKFVSLFTVAEGLTFEEVFKEEVDKFYENIRHLTTHET